MPRERAVSVGLRTAHLVAFGLLLGGHYWDVPPERLGATLGVTLVSGAALVGIELYRTCHWLFLGKGLCVVAKLLLLLLVPLFWPARVPILLAVVVVASVGAHMPARYRNYSILRGTVYPPPRIPEPLGPHDGPREAEIPASRRARSGR